MHILVSSPEDRKSAIPGLPHPDNFGSKASLLVFKQDDQVARAIAITGDYLRADTIGPFGPDVLASAWGDGALPLKVPSGAATP